jgi:3-demethoxyubiquinol 3-hydroxylase
VRGSSHRSGVEKPTRLPTCDDASICLPERAIDGLQDDCIPTPTARTATTWSENMDVRECLTVARILKVNHAGEYGAIRIYRAQIFIARHFYPDVLPFLEETLSHEISHCASFRGAMPGWHARPCRIMALWANGGSILGLLTALLGRQGIWICTAAVEAAVHRHFEDQLLFLRDRDSSLYALIKAIQNEELMHLRHAEERIATPTFAPRLLSAFISKFTDIAIRLSTWGTLQEWRGILL